MAARNDFSEPFPINGNFLLLIKLKKNMMIRVLGYVLKYNCIEIFITLRDQTL